MIFNNKLIVFDVVRWQSLWNKNKNRQNVRNENILYFFFCFLTKTKGWKIDKFKQFGQVYLTSLLNLE